MILDEYFRGLAIDEPWQRIDITPGQGQSTTSTNRIYLADALGSIIGLTDTNKVIQTEYDYEPFGSTTTTGAGNKNSYKFTAREDDVTGLYYYRARYYHPALGRFVSEDPVEYDGEDINLYRYVYDDPLNLSDPWGLVGVGFTAGGTGSAGLWNPSAAATGSLGYGAFGGEGFNHGGFASGGAFYRSPWCSAGAPPQTGRYGAFGAFLGAGVGAFLTNANRPCDLEKTYKTTSFDIGWVYKISVQVSSGNDIWSLSVTFGAGAGAGLTHLNTATAGGR